MSAYPATLRTYGRVVRRPLTDVRRARRLFRVALAMLRAMPAAQTPHKASSVRGMTKFARASHRTLARTVRHYHGHRGKA